MNAQQLRELYVRFFESKGHQHYPSGSLIPYDVTGRLDESLLFNGAGMIQFKPYFRGVAQPSNKRMVTVQKCVRTGDIDETGDLSHLTFFEMLGNFSFGDYFKKEAIAFSWEFLTSPEWLNLDPKRLSFTVFQDDDEAYDAWTSFGPDVKVFRLGEDTNYWPAGAFTNGPPGPCGPNSEMFFWAGDGEPPSGPYTVEDWKRDDAAGNWLEIWNDVFIQYEWQGELRDPSRPASGFKKTGMPGLPFQSIDTGMGLERTAAVLSGFRSVYDTDVFQPILRNLESLMGGYKYGSDPDKDRAIRIIADHIRTASFCIGDGILPSNNGRGYVLRRLIRRGVLKGFKALGFSRPFFHEVFEAVLDAMGAFYKDLSTRHDIIRTTLYNEEVLFRRTMDYGEAILRSTLNALVHSSSMDSSHPHGSVLEGALAFKLYDTFGFPLEVTQELCAERGVKVDIDGYEKALAEAQERSRGASGMDTVYGGVAIVFEFTEDDGKATPTKFMGYETTHAQATIVGAIPQQDEQGNLLVAVALDQTPFYAESGGQVSDIGTLKGEGFELKVVDLTKQDGVFVHVAEPVQLTIPVEHLFGQKATATVESDRRDAIRRNHTATHLLHAALRNTLGKHVTQAGSLVNEHQLRFDFTHGAALTPDQIRDIEEQVYAEILNNISVTTYADLPIDEAKKKGAMALFGEKYGDKVRMVEIGDYSRELCGGIHVRSTGDIGLFKITHEASAASGIRRIEAVTGHGAFAWVNQQQATLKDAATHLKTTPKDLVTAIQKLHDQLREEKKKREKLAAQGSATAENVVQAGAFELVLQKLEGELKDATLVADRLIDGHPGRVAVIGVLGEEGKVGFVCKVGADALAKGAHAGNLVREVAKVAGGGGGGKPDFATAGGKDATQIDAALEKAVEVLSAV